MTAPTEPSTKRTNWFPVTSCISTTPAIISNRSGDTETPTHDGHRPTTPATSESQPDSTINTANAAANTSNGAT
ncbi:hypothetical protein H7J70_02275 [Mycolicibacterium celeriflavum]|uniref:Uncharacterized protein n=1 Tax=Mycolicibacterium celeriflavum TaxID=1249101 RepID=A0A7I7RLR1_MYCCF|nr:hypothetical protein [Mycolicibacterium celeriflavum]BBY45504.1 hypothetical protein MCEL_37990 [Mycolicibacterium celeriflavum]